MFNRVVSCPTEFDYSRCGVIWICLDVYLLKLKKFKQACGDFHSLWVDDSRTRGTRYKCLNDNPVLSYSVFVFNPKSLLSHYQRIWCALLANAYQCCYFCSERVFLKTMPTTCGTMRNCGWDVYLHFVLTIFINVDSKKCCTHTTL